MRKKNKGVFLLIFLTAISIIAIRVIANYPFYEKIKTKFVPQNEISEQETFSPLEEDKDPFPTVPEITPLFDSKDIPQGDTFEISGVTVPNFFKNASHVDEIIGEVMVVDHPNYKIFYYPINEGFIIPIIASPFEKVRPKAEEAFLQALGIEKEEACKLKVEITTSYAVNPQQAGITHKLSWCE
jgi:hypothetical protein